jgi:hypothetical protein
LAGDYIEALSASLQNIASSARQYGLSHSQLPYSPRAYQQDLLQQFFLYSLIDTSRLTFEVIAELCMSDRIKTGCQEISA